MAAAPPTGKFSLIAKVQAKGESEAAELAELFKKLVARANSDEEPNCLYYKPSRSVEDPLSFVVYEEYDNNGGTVATDAHFAGTDYQNLIKLAPTLTNGVEIKFYTPL